MLEKRAVTDFKFGVNSHSSIPHSCIASSGSPIELQNYLQSSLYERVPKKMDWNLWVVSMIKTTYANYIYFHRE